jgi:hypothetical protein
MIAVKNIRAHKESKAFGIQSKKPLSTEDLKIEESVFY